MSKERKVRRVETPRIGPGMHAEHRVRHILEPGDFEDHDPFLMLADDWFVPGTFGEHPHRGFETVTYVIEGTVEHRDNHGGHGVLHAGDAQWMTAGRGVIHSEEAASPVVHSLQLWRNLPRAKKMSPPSYQDLRGDEMPTRRDDGAEVRVFSGTSGDVTGPARNLEPTTMVELRLDAGATVRQELADGFNAFLYIISGSGRFGADRTRADEAQVIWFERDGGDVVVEADSALHAILWAGPPIGEPVAARGPFVMNTLQELQQAWVDFQSGNF